MSAFRVNRPEQRLSRAEKAAIATNDSARTIIQNEVVARESKTERLRQERLAKEVSKPSVEKPKQKQARKPKG